MSLVRRWRSGWHDIAGAQRRWIAAVALAVGAAQIRQPFPDLAPLQHLPTVLLLVLSPWLLGRWPLSTRSVALVGTFLLLHTLGGRYIYSYVPYDAWAETLTGHSISATFGLHRNGYDRLVHAMFGILLVPVLAEATMRHGALDRRWSIGVAVLAIGTASALYEIFEWSLSITMGADLAGAYNGEQGDPWDAQKDMAVAILGACVSAGWCLARGRSKHRIVSASKD